MLKYHSNRRSCKKKVQEERSAFKVPAGEQANRSGSRTTSIVDKMSHLHPGRPWGFSLALCHSFGLFPARETTCAVSELFSAAGPCQSVAGQHACWWIKGGGAENLPGSFLIPAFCRDCMFLNAGLR